MVMRNAKATLGVEKIVAAVKIKSTWKMMRTKGRILDMRFSASLKRIFSVIDATGLWYS